MASVGVGGCNVIFLFLTLCAVSSERMNSKIYDSVDGAAACFRRLNGTHQFGCTSHRTGNVGIVHLVELSSDVTWLVEEGNAVPYMVVMHPPMFTRDILLELQKSGKVNGVALISNATLRPDNFSHEDTCPNRYSGLSSFSNQTCGAHDPLGTWNPKGTKIMMMDWEFPIFYVNSENAIKKIEKCYYNFNSNGRNKVHNQSLCAMEMSSFMFATVNSAICTRRTNMMTNFNPVRFCDPLGDRNVWCTLFARNKTAMSQPKINSTVFVVATRLDTSSMFDGVTPGAVTPTTGIVTLLATAHILFQLKNNEGINTNNNVLFVLFNGESYDYIGSSRMVWDMKEGKFPSQPDDAVDDQPPPLHLHDLALFIELSHLTDQYNKSQDASTLVFHTTNNNSVKSLLHVQSFIEKMSQRGSDFHLKFKTTNAALPPASLQSFVAHSSDYPVPGVLIADYAESFTTKYYHSVYDDATDLNYEYQNGSEPQSDSIQAFVANISTTLAYSLYYMLTEKNYTGTLQADIKLIDELFHCYIDKVNCSVFQEATFKTTLSDKPASLYVGVESWRGPNQITVLTGQALAYLTGTRVNKTEKDCRNNPQQQIYQYLWMQGNESLGESGICIQTTMNYSFATSPAFEMPDYNWTSGNYSTWTESVWQDLRVRVFLKPSRQHEIKIFSIGAVIFCLSFMVVYFLNARSHIIFGNTLGTGAC